MVTVLHTMYCKFCEVNYTVIRIISSLSILEARNDNSHILTSDWGPNYKLYMEGTVICLKSIKMLSLVGKASRF